MIASQYPDWLNVTVYCSIVHTLAIFVAAKLGSNPDWGWIYKRQLAEIVMLTVGTITPAIFLGIFFHSTIVGLVLPVALAISLRISYKTGRSSYERQRENLLFQWQYTEGEEREEVLSRLKAR